MEELDQRLAEEIVNHIKQEVLTVLPAKLDQLSSENVESFRNKLRVLHYYCLQKGVGTHITDALEATMETSWGFWEFLEDNEKTLTDLNETYKMRLYDLGSGVISELEEIISGEESFRDVIVNSIAILLGWKADTIWVDMAKEDQRQVPRLHIARLRDELWRFISESSRNGGEMTLSKASEISDKMHLLLKYLASDDMPMVMRIMMLSQIYILLIRLRMGKIIMNLETDSKEA